MCNVCVCIFMTQGKIRRGSKQLLTPFANCLHFEDQAICTFCLLQYQVSYQLTQNLLFVDLDGSKKWDGANLKIAKSQKFL